MTSAWARSLAGASAGAIYGAALARGLFEAAPAGLSALGAWPGGLALAGVGGLAGALLAARLSPDLSPLVALWLPLVGVVAPDVNGLRSAVLLLGAPALAVGLWLSRRPELSPSHARLLATAWPVTLGLALLTLYLRTLAPTVGEADAFEFQVSVARLGIAHGNGYPLLLLVGKIFESLPIGPTVVWRVNASAAAAAGLAAVGVWASARRLGVDALPAWLAAFALGAAPSLWARATEIEAYALNAALTAALLYVGVGVAERPAETQPRSLYIWAGLFGLSLTNHLTAAMLAPALGLAGLAWLVVQTRRQPAERRAAFVVRQLAFILGAALLGLAVYAYLPWRWPAVGGGEPFTLERFLYFVRGGEAAAQFDAFLPLKEPQRFAYVFRKLTSEFTVAGFALVVLGGAAGLCPRTSAPSRWRAGLFLLLAGLGHLYFVLAYNPPEPDFGDFFIAPFTIAAVFLALGLQTLSAFLARASSAAPLGAVALSLFALIPLSSVWTNLPRLDLSRGNDRLAVGAYTLAQPLAEGAAVLADPKRFAAPYYLQVTEHQRPDLDIRVLPDEASYRAVIEERLAAGQAVYLARYLPGLGAAYSLRSVGPLAEVAPGPFLQPPTPVAPLSATLAEGIQLVGYRLEAALPGERFLTLFWHAPAAPSASLAVYLRLVDVAGAVAWQNAGRLPVDGLYPTNAWRPGEYVSDFHRLPLAATLTPGAYQLQAGLFPPFQPRAEGWAAVTTLTITAPEVAPAPAQALRARLGDAWLLGYDAPASALPGAPVAVTLYWQPGPSGTVSAFGETRSLSAWEAVPLVPQRYTLTAPATGAALDLSVSSGGPARCGWLQPETEACALPSVLLAGAALPPEAVRYSDQLVLRAATLATTTARPGDGVSVSLEWQALRPLSESYTVFVHVVGPDGRLYGQVDYWPVEGTRLTTSWLPGEIIRDPYTVRLAADAPPGAYTVHVGLYLLETLERLPVFNAEGAPVDDKFVLTGLTVR